jgi:hypothetical protein
MSMDKILVARKVQNPSECDKEQPRRQHRVFMKSTRIEGTRAQINAMAREVGKETYENNQHPEYLQHKPPIA